MTGNQLNLILGLAIVWAPIGSSSLAAAVASTPRYVGMQGIYAMALETKSQQPPVKTPDDWLQQGEQQLAAEQWQAALQSLAKAEQGFQQRGDRQNLAFTYLLQGDVYRQLENNAQALERYQKALPAFSSQPQILARLMLNQADAYQRLGKLAEAMQTYEQVEQLGTTQSDPQLLAVVLTNKGALHRALGNEQQALISYQQAQVLLEQVGDRLSLASVLMSLGNIQNKLGNPRAALGHYDQAQGIFEALGDRAGLGSVLLNQGKLYGGLDQHQAAIAAYQQAEPLLALTGKSRQRGLLLLNRGFSRRSLGQNEVALRDYQQALALVQGDRSNEGYVLSNLGELFEAQGQAELAILFYKQSVKLREAIRQPLGQLAPNLEQTYVRSVADTYRALAALLIRQGRLPEAQAVLEQLKLQELEDFTRDGAIGGQGIDLTQVEEVALNQILEQFGTVAQFGQQLFTCERQQCRDLEALQTQRSQLFESMGNQLMAIETDLQQHFSSDLGAVDRRRLNAEARNIVNAAPGMALLYPLVLEDKIQLLLALKTGQRGVVFRPFEISDVSSDRLLQTISRFRNQLSDSSGAGPTASIASVQATGQQLYDWLIKPLEAELQTAQIEHLVIAPDRSTRYIPFGALHNGQQYLAERLALSTVAAASGTDTRERFPKAQGNQPFLLAMGASVFPDFSPLGAVPAEVDAIVQTDQASDQQGIYPGSEFLDEQFDYDSLRSQIGGHRVLHIATHGIIQPGRPKDSYLVTGKQVNGKAERITTTQIDELLNYGLSDIHLVVLSACETGVGDRNSDGIEIPGISYFFLRNDVKSVMASLWSVNDASTSLMMQEFYRQLAEAGVGKAEAIRRVQTAFIRSELTGQNAPVRASVAVAGGASRAGATDFRHPYYWAPFILIGNGL